MFGFLKKSQPAPKLSIFSRALSFVGKNKWYIGGGIVGVSVGSAIFSRFSKINAELAELTELLKGVSESAIVKDGVEIPNYTDQINAFREDVASELRKLKNELDSKYGKIIETTETLINEESFSRELEKLSKEIKETGDSGLAEKLEQLESKIDGIKIPSLPITKKQASDLISTLEKFSSDLKKEHVDLAECITVFEQSANLLKDLGHSGLNMSPETSEKFDSLVKLLEEVKETSSRKIEAAMTA